MAQDHIPVYMANPGVQHIGLDRPPQIVKDQSFWLLFAGGYSRLFTGREKGFLQPPRGWAGLRI